MSCLVLMVVLVFVGSIRLRRVRVRSEVVSSWLMTRTCLTLIPDSGL